MNAKNANATITYYKTITSYAITPELIDKLINDIAIVKVRVVFKENAYEAGFYNGEMNAFYICLDLLAKVEDRFKAMGLRRRFDVLADAIGLERTADPREILDAVIKKVGEQNGTN